MPAWTVLAANDLRAQLTYIARENPEAAKNAAITIKVACAALDQFPKIGRQGAVKDTRELVVPGTPYICVYRIVSRRVEILRLLHAKMMWPQ
ncbi:MAG: type II toxin-antitoxin system RelE/ParE family toxin [Desulfovibrionaceae bacterium]|nr:type II toxin-antitoxin system RelE/ParE family toxin [Desulfovibrionaceae bacterium]MBF0513266.1 type II toxin-antitoxin system RelE/ParE family toxin [Desulfovibrionaceae bacterium]